MFPDHPDRYCGIVQILFDDGSGNPDDGALPGVASCIFQGMPASK
jgi:hypothetical protein